MKKNRLKKNTKGNAGFTLVETLVAVAVLMIAIAGPLTVAEKGLSASIYARDQLTASYLAQDAVEYIKNMVDTNESRNGNDQSDWLTYKGTDLTKLCTKSTPCMIDTTPNVSTVFSPCIGPTTNGIMSQCTALVSTAIGYTQGTGSASPFTRGFYLVPIPLKDGSVTDNYAAAEVVAEVVWPGDTVGGAGGVTLVDTIYNAF